MDINQAEPTSARGLSGCVGSARTRLWVRQFWPRSDSDPNCFASLICLVFCFPGLFSADRRGRGHRFRNSIYCSTSTRKKHLCGAFGQSATGAPLWPRPQAYNIGSAANVRGHWHHLKGNRKADRGEFFQLSFKPSFIFLTHAMADTQVDSGSDISAKVSPTCPRGAARPRRLTGDPDSPRGSAASSRSFALWYRTRSLPCVRECVRRAHVPRRWTWDGVALLARAFRTGLRVGSLSGGNSPRGFFVYPPAWFLVLLEPRTPGTSSGYGRTPTQRALRCAVLTLTPTLTRVFLNLFRISSVRSRCLDARRPVSERSGPAR